MQTAPERGGRGDAMTETERRGMLALLKLAHRYLDNQEVRKIPFAMNSGCVAKRIKKVLNKTASADRRHAEKGMWANRVHENRDA